jgi:hypothetical protein
MSAVVNFADFQNRKPARAAMQPAPGFECVSPNNPDDRDKRYAIWQKAETAYEFYDRLCDVAHPASFAFKKHGVRDAEPLAHLSEMENWLPLVDKRKAARDRLLLTPAPTVASLNRKKAILASRRQTTINQTTRVQAAKLIAADEVWLKATAPQRRARRPCT